MKYLRPLLIILINLILVSYAYSQIKQSQQKGLISTQIVILRYEKQTDTLKIPIVSDKYPALKKVLSYQSLFNGDDLQDVIKKYDSCGCGITGLNYKITFESKRLISIILYFDTMGTHPDSNEEWLTLNIYTGKLYPISHEISQKGLKWLFENYKATL